jgi:hypothetical protein
MNRLLHHHLLSIFVDGRDDNFARKQDEGAPADLQAGRYRRARGKRAQLHLAGEHGNLIVIEQREERDMAKFIGWTRHGWISVAGKGRRS